MDSSISLLRAFYAHLLRGAPAATLWAVELVDA